MRADTMGIAAHPVIQTPVLDELGTSGFHFTNAYSACPICIPARRTIMSGQKPVTHGCVHNANRILEAPTLPQILGEHGYQTHLSGKLHLWPERKHYGFQSMDWADGPGCQAQEEPHGKGDADADYARWINRELGSLNIHRPQVSHGITGNAWNIRTWQWDERLHFTNWCTDTALNFLGRRDPTRPFFLKLSYFHPHPPLTPPQFYYDRYINQELPKPVVGSWAKKYSDVVIGTPRNNPARINISKIQMKQLRAAYYASINHIDDQINRVLEILPKDTIVLFTSDHGEMLGDHQHYAKSKPYEGSANIPFLLSLPGSDIQQGKTIDHPVALMDIMPTLLDLADIPIPQSVDGLSLMPLLKGETLPRTYIHGECSNLKNMDTGMQYLTDGKRKYVWLPGLGQEQFFNLEDDPHECEDLCQCDTDDLQRDEIKIWRECLIKELANRPEGFTDGKTLLTLKGQTPSVVPGHPVNEAEVIYYT